jgi:hypothetical protein
MKVEHFHVKNQFVVWDDNGNKFFQSYNSIIVKEDKEGNITLDKYFWDYSKTTGKYRNLFLMEEKKETERKIKEGIYKLESLN